MSQRAIIHTITPGDHFSPRTGSAIPTVVDGLASAATAAGAARHSVVIDRSTFVPRYRSADVLEYAGARGPRRSERYRDIVRGRFGGERAATASYYRPIADAVRALPPSIVLAHNAPLLPWLLRDTEHRVVLYAHNELLRTYSRAEAGRVLNNAAAIVCVSSSLAEATASRLPRRFTDRIRVVRNGSDVHRFTPRVAEPGSPPVAAPQTVRVVFVGRVIPEKGADVLLRAAALTTNRRLEFTVVGSSGFARDAALSPHEQELRLLAEKVRAPVRFEPFADRAALPRLLRDADILVIPSRWPDPCPLTVGEGLAAGLPIIASRIGGIPEIVAPSTRLVAADDPAALAAELDALAGDRPLRERLARDARAWAETHDWPSAWRQLHDALAGI